MMHYRRRCEARSEMYDEYIERALEPASRQCALNASGMPSLLGRAKRGADSKGEQSG